MTTARVTCLAILLTAAFGAAPAPAAGPIVTEGVIRSAARVEIKSRVAAPIRRVAVEEGQRVTAGDVLIELVNDVERAQLVATEADLERARATLAAATLRAETARREYERTRQVEDLLTEKDVELSRDAMRQAESTLEIARREVDSTAASVALSRTVLDATFVRAPFTGVVSRIHVTVGMMPKPTETALIDLTALDRLTVEVAIPLEHLGAVREGTQAEIVVEPDSPEPPRLDGTVSFVYPEVDPNTRMFRVKIRLAKVPRGVMPGMFARVTLAGT